MSQWKRQRDREHDLVWKKWIALSTNRAIKAFGGVAKSGGLTMRTVAGRVAAGEHGKRRVGVDIRAFQRYFESHEPKVETLAAVARALDFDEPGLLARAFRRELNAGELRKECGHIEAAIASARRLFGARAKAAAKAFHELMAGDDRTLCQQVCSESVIARHGIRDRLPAEGDDPEDDPYAPSDYLFGLWLGAVHFVLDSERRFSFFDFLGKKFYGAVELGHERFSHLLSAQETLGLPARQAKKNAEIVWRLISPPGHVSPLGRPYDRERLKRHEVARKASLKTYYATITARDKEKR